MPLRHSYTQVVNADKAPAVIPGRLEEANPESRDSGSGPSDHPGM